MPEIATPVDAVDLPLWRDLARRWGQPVLELGCGDGRVALDLARSGIVVWALDHDGEALGRLAARLEGEPPEVSARLRIVEADARRYDLPMAFRTVVWARDGLGLLLDGEDRRAALATAAAHLHEGGALCLSVAHGPRIAAETVDPVTGTVGVRDPATGAAVALHAFTAPELRALLGWAGLVPVRVRGAYDGRPLDAASDRIIVEAARA